MIFVLEDGDKVDLESNRNLELEWGPDNWDQGFDGAWPQAFGDTWPQNFDANWP